MRIDYSDQVEIFDPNKWGWPVHIIGMGGIGSAVFLPLLKLGVPELHIWDTDVVESRNIPAQLIYRPSDIGKLKVDAAAGFAERQEVDCEVIVHREPVTAETELEGIVICGVHSMDDDKDGRPGRKDIWKAVHNNPLVPLFMDCRLGGEYIHQFTLNPLAADDAAKYATTLFADEQASALACGARTVIHPPTQIAAWVVANLTLFARGESPRFSLMAGMRRMQYVVG